MAESPRSFRDKNLNVPPPPEYQPPSMLAQHKGLAILFAVVFMAIAAYCYLVPRGTRYAAPPKQPIYVDSVPQ